MKRSLGVVLSILIAPIGIGAASPREAAGELPALSADLEPLRTAFNEAKGRHRILAVVSPTCGACRLGVTALQKSILSKDDPQLRVFIVWSPMLKRDNEQTAREAAASVKDPHASRATAAAGYPGEDPPASVAARTGDARVQQFLDLSRYAGSALRRELFPNARADKLKSLPPDHYVRDYIETSAQDKPEWDIYLSFPADAEWRERVPQPDRWIRQGALFPDDHGNMVSLLWLDDYAAAPVEADLIRTMARLLQ